ncbi:MAG TPA: HD domain-containing protein [Firmicutes bacterium]|nr:HD domain-containing protein [Bacillota bacterium]HOQ23683.1 HD domain-containing protein [Bacillota bacterium]HPT67099.1 HD domain-containing protein [Bacillota bacterium]
MSQPILNAVKTIVEKELSCAAHNLDHVHRVYATCLRLAEGEPGVDLEVLQLAALLHDIARVREDTDPTGQIDHAVAGAQMAGEILAGLQYNPEKTAAVVECIRTHRFRSDCPPQRLEAKILFDADKLDVLGAIGLARSYALAGQYGEPLYNQMPLEKYIRENLVGADPAGRVKDIAKHTTDLEFELKLKHLPARLFTEKARAIARDRVAFMVDFFARLHREINGEA